MCSFSCYCVPVPYLVPGTCRVPLLGFEFLSRKITAQLHTPAVKR